MPQYVCVCAHTLKASKPPRKSTTVNKLFGTRLDLESMLLTNRLRMRRPSRWLVSSWCPWKPAKRVSPTSRQTKICSRGLRLPPTLPRPSSSLAWLHVGASQEEPAAEGGMVDIKSILEQPSSNCYVCVEVRFCGVRCCKIAKCMGKGGGMGKLQT